jgi:DNA invertase Pin-like site-specific DNA recombinase
MAARTPSVKDRCICGHALGAHIAKGAGKCTGAPDCTCERFDQQLRAIAYYRVSTVKQGRSGLGLEAQEAAVAAYIASSGSKLLAPPYREIESGKNNARPQLAAAIAHAKRAHATLVIAKLDRLARNVAFVSNLMESGVDFVACDNPHATRLTVHILAAVAEDEARAISERTKAALTAAKARGTKLGTNNLTAAGTIKGSAAGVAAIKRNKAAAYADLAPMIVDLASEGLSLRAIAAKLNEQGELTRRGRPWAAVQVQRVLRDAGSAS